MPYELNAITLCAGTSARYLAPLEDRANYELNKGFVAWLIKSRLDKLKNGFCAAT
jgi:hypothetical protein